MRINKEEQSRNTFIFGKKDLEKALKKYLYMKGEYTETKGEKTIFSLNDLEIKDCAELSIKIIVINSSSNSEEI